MSVPTHEEMTMATASTPIPTTDHNYSIPVSSSQPTPAPIYFITTTISLGPANAVSTSHAITDILRSAVNMGPHPISLS